MNAGLPGTGIGGFFYLLCAFALPITETYYTLKGRSSLKRWLFVIKQVSIAIGILLSVEIAGIFLRMIFGAKQVSIQNTHSIIVSASQGIVIKPFFLSLIVLVSVLLFIRGWALVKSLNSEEIA